MLNVTVVGTALSGYYLSDPALFLTEQRSRIEHDADIPLLRRELRRLTADVDDTTPLGQARSRILGWLAHFGWRFETRPSGIDEPVIGTDAAGAKRVYVLVTPPGQHLDAAPTGRRSGKARPQRQAEMIVRPIDAPAKNPTLPAVLLTNGSELRVIRRDPGLGGETNYLSIDLAGLANSDSTHEWQVIWALLRPEAFTADSAGDTLWDAFEKASVSASARVSEDLASNVREAISALANGALADRRRRGLSDPAPQQLFADTMRIAYRLLFISYAEDLNLLPIGNPLYEHGYSLRGLRRLVTDSSLEWGPDGGFLWGTLRSLWGMLREGGGAGELLTAAFNGGLFKPEQCPTYDLDGDLIVGDAYVKVAIEAIGFTQPVTRANRRSVVGRRPINYRELGVEQLGSVYEGLLAYEPQIAQTPMRRIRSGRGQNIVEQIVPASEMPEDADVVADLPEGSFYLFEATGQRKGSGSYYTPRKLAHFMVVEAIQPLLENASSEQILNLRICDPAMGSGAFLVPAVHLLAEAYGAARIREGLDADHQIDNDERAQYRRTVVERCIYGVDLNPMAVDLAKVSLWLTTAAKGKPLSFLDAHLRCGNSVVGVDPLKHDMLPDAARSRAKAFDASPDQQRLFDELPEPKHSVLVRSRRRLASAPSDDRRQVQDKEKAFDRIVRGEDYSRLRDLGDWVLAPTFVRLKGKAINGKALRWTPEAWTRGREDILYGREPDPGMAQIHEQVRTVVREQVRPFHWRVEFPEVFFDEDGNERPDAGFDAIIGNPPWEGINVKAAEFFGRFDPTYVLKKTQQRRAREQELLSRPEVAAAWQAEQERLSSIKWHIKGTYTMLYDHGSTFNYYRVFLERAMSLLAPGGRLGMTIDAGVVAGAATAQHRRELLEQYTVDWFVLCDNTEKIFPIDSREQFLLLIATKGGKTPTLRFTSGVSNLKHLEDLGSRTVKLPTKTLATLDPTTLSIPDIRDPKLLDLLTTIYEGRPLLLDRMPVGGWRIEWGRELHLDDDKRFFGEDGSGASLLEGKHIHQFVHDFEKPTYRLRMPDGELNLLNRARKRTGRKGDPERWARRNGEKPLKEAFREGGLEVPFDQYRPCFREVARTTDERTMIAAVVPPRTALAHSTHWFYRSEWHATGYRTILPANAMVYVVGLLNSLVVDFVIRRKAVAHVTKSVMATVPVPDVPLDHGPGADVVRLSARLVCRAPVFSELAEVLGVPCAPLSKAEEHELRAELDARVAHLYGLSKDQLELILTDFRQSESAESSPVRPNDSYKDMVRAHFARILSGEDRSSVYGT